MSKKKIDYVGSWIFDDNVNSTSDEFFDNVLKQVDFPLEDVEGNILSDDWDASFRLLELPSSDVLEGCPSSYCGKICEDISAPDRSLSRNEDKAKVKASPSCTETNSNRSISHYQTSNDKDCSLENSSSGSIENSLLFSSKFLIPVKRARSKRLRPLTPKTRFNFPFVSSASSASGKYRPLAASGSFSESCHYKKSFSKRKGKERNLHLLSGAKEMNSASQNPSPARKCMHCEVTKTPQWREGPMGPKTLCNACGVRYRSGRLFPEYRPAASPTFVSSLHSNSHRKVIEMRKKADHKPGFAAMNNLRCPPVTMSDGRVPV
ncbi:GATA transcription factor 11-like isoform X2 [Rhodamnia argentea]|uniref:GATA transcription factor 11-like isoform X2 n=1 Tax=Rhodamnia argentea TaxID=178133 RepID=A0A8B8NVY3_9MYRT|nr:GATA transcription factor 11-like isoform X2 [Rhodamnia argentea]